jgi:hypothetical protein
MKRDGYTSGSWAEKVTRLRTGKMGGNGNQTGGRGLEGFERKLKKLGAKILALSWKGA